MVLSEKVSARPGGIHGHCWFAGQPIKAGEHIWWKGDMQYNDIDIPKTTIDTWPQADQEKFMSLAYQVAPGIYRGTDPAKAGQIPQEEQNEYYVNHTCDGNCWYENDDLLVASRDIAVDEEIAYDYALTESDPDWILAPQCLCGKSICRGKVTGNDWKLPELRAKYGKHFTEHIVKMIEQEQQN